MEATSSGVMPSLQDHESCMLRGGSNLWCTVHLRNIQGVLLLGDIEHSFEGANVRR